MLLRRLQYLSNYTVVRWQLLLSALMVLIAGRWLKSQYGETIQEPEATDLWLVMRGFISILWGVLAVLFGFSIFTSAAAWLFFVFRARNKKIGLQTQFGEGQKAEAGFVPVTITVLGVFRPFLGSVRARLVFTGKKLSEPIVLDKTIYKPKSIARHAISGTGKTLLHDRGIYDVEEVQLQFCDLFRFIAIPYTMHVSQQLYTLPQEQKALEVKAQPNTTEEQTHRIEIPKRVEGEYINYKDFETGDDVRRIVWKIYARSGNLVVRIPETMDPYASHLYFYASFYNGMNESPEGHFETELLNCYKDKVRNLFEALQKNGFDVRIPHDQEVPKLSGMSDKKNEMFHIAAAGWQKDKPPALFVHSGKAAFVCVSSLVPVSEITQLLNDLPLNVPIVAVKMSDAIRSPFSVKLKNIFFRPERLPADKLSQPWLLSPLRSRLQKNERELSMLFQRRGNSWVIPCSDKS